MDELKMKISQAIGLIDNNQLKEAQQCLAEVVGEYISSPEIYNLYGILEEYKGDYAKAAKFYRASYAFDPSYKPASANLARVTSFAVNTSKSLLDFGREQKDEDTGGQYYIEYDEFRVGHIKKKSKKAE